MADSGHVQALAETTYERPPIRELREIASDLNFNKVLKWETVECLDQFHALITRPPLHSVVIKIWPVVAGALLKTTNVRNRRPLGIHVKRLSEVMTDGQFEITGDTIKFDTKGRLLDSQHRLLACAQSDIPITSHVVFGLDEAIFDVLDQIHKRTAADILGLAGVPYPAMVAGAILWAEQMKEGDRNWSVRRLTPRQIRKLATGPMRDIKDWAPNGLLINKAFKQPPSFITGLLYLISKHSRLVAEDFAKSWVHGARIGRNKNFDVLNQRTMTVRKQSKGHMNRDVNAAMVIKMFNYWNAGIVATPNAITWERKWTFPKLEFDKAAFLKNKNQSDREDTSLKAQQMRVLAAMVDMVGPDAEVSAPVTKIATAGNVHPRQVPEVIRTLIEGKSLTRLRKATDTTPALYRISAFDKKATNGSAARA